MQPHRTGALKKIKFNQGEQSMIAIIAKIPIKEEKLNEAIEAFKQLMKEVAKEEGTMSYTLNVSKKDPTTLVILERYKDRESLDAHSSTPHFKAFQAKIGDLVGGRAEITRMDELASIR
jgi:quinol monooxygenase YgiN